LTCRIQQEWNNARVFDEIVLFRVKTPEAVNKCGISCEVPDDGFNKSGLFTDGQIYDGFINRFVDFFKLFGVTEL
jgi:hypothetical protein